MKIMTKRTTPTTTWGTIARVLRDLGLKQGFTGDFQVRGFYRRGERDHTYVVTTSRVSDLIFENADAIEKVTSAYGMPFYVSVRYATNGRRWVTIDNHSRIREEAPARQYVERGGGVTAKTEERPPSPEIADDGMLTECRDGKVREIARTVYRSGEPERIVCTDGTEWVTADCKKPQENHVTPPVPNTTAAWGVPLDDAAAMVGALMSSAVSGIVPTETALRDALEPYFLAARRDTLNETLTALRGIGASYERSTAMRVVKGLRDGTYA